jgi:hypothetical protein
MAHRRPAWPPVVSMRIRLSEITTSEKPETSHRKATVRLQAAAHKFSSGQDSSPDYGVTRISSHNMKFHENDWRFYKNISRV